MYGSRPPFVPTCRRLLDALLPVGCLSCGRRLPTDTPALLLCVVCRGRARPVVQDRCPRCLERHLGTASCALAPRAFDQIVAPWSYEPPWDAVLQALKFRRLDFLGPRLAKVLAAAVRRETTGLEVVTAVPLHPLRRWRRGFDQAECIARPLAEALGLPYRRLLRRRRWTRAQSRLGRRERRRNLAGAFVARGPCEGSVLLVDDVYTTGATVDAASRALRRRGTPEVIVATLAATPRSETSNP